MLPEMPIPPKYVARAEAKAARQRLEERDIAELKFVLGMAQFAVAKKLEESDKKSS